MEKSLHIFWKVSANVGSMFVDKLTIYSLAVFEKNIRPALNTGLLDKVQTLADIKTRLDRLHNLKSVVFPRVVPPEQKRLVYSFSKTPKSC